MPALILSPAPEPTGSLIVPVRAPSPEPLHHVHGVSLTTLLVVGLAGAVISVALALAARRLRRALRHSVGARNGRRESRLGA
jgi:hypothetical protein